MYINNFISYEVSSQTSANVFQFHVKNDFILVKYKIQSLKPHLLLCLTLSLLSPNTFSLLGIIVYNLLSLIFFFNIYILMVKVVKMGIPRKIVGDRWDRGL